MSYKLRYTWKVTVKKTSINCDHIKKHYKQLITYLQEQHFSRIGTSLFCTLLFCSISLFLKSDSEGFALIAFKKRAAVSKTLFGSQKTSDSLQKIHSFHHVFDIFSLLSPILFPRADRSCNSSLPSLLTKKRVTMSASLPSLFKKERHRD